VRSAIASRSKVHLEALKEEIQIFLKSNPCTVFRKDMLNIVGTASVLDLPRFLIIFRSFWEICFTALGRLSTRRFGHLAKVKIGIRIPRGYPVSHYRQA
jgi:hypothetical protein